MTLNTRHDPKITPQAISVSRGAALTGGLAHTGVSRPGILPAVERSLASSAVAVPCGHSPRKRAAFSLWSSPGIESFRFPVYTGVFQSPARCAVPWPLLTPLRVVPSGSPQARARCFPARPPHLPPRRNRSTSLCGAGSPHRGRPWYAVLVHRPAGFRYPSFRRAVALPALASHSRSSRFHVRSFRQGTCTPFATRPCWAHTNGLKLSATRSRLSLNR